MATTTIPTNITDTITNHYDKLLEMIKCLDLQDDCIKMNHKIQSIEKDFCTVVKDERMLSESMDYMNNEVLNDNEASLKFALLFSSRNFDSLAMNDSKVRCKMLNILETNFSNAEKYRQEDKNRLYNSITLLGEYYHRVRLADGSPIKILGESLLFLLTQEINIEELLQNDNCQQNVIIDLKLAKLILSQVTLNGDLIRTKHPKELNILLYHIRKILIEKPNLHASVKALLLMTLDLYYSNFTSLSTQLEAMYTKYLVEEERFYHEEEAAIKNEFNQYLNNTLETITICNYVEKEENGDFSGNLSNEQHIVENVEEEEDEIIENLQPQKKWSEQVCEDSLYESEFGNEFIDNNETGYQSLPIQLTDDNNSSLLIQEEEFLDLYEPQILSPVITTQIQEEFDNNYHENNIVQQGLLTPQSRPQSRSKQINHYQNNRYNQQQSHANRNQRNDSGKRSDDDRFSVRSENGSIRLYSVEDRLKHSQTQKNNTQNTQNTQNNHEKWEQRSGSGGFHSNNETNITRPRQQRSHSRNSNYENGGAAKQNVVHSSNFRNHHQQQQQNNRHNNYDRPPRFRNQDSSWRHHNAATSQDHLTTTTISNTNLNNNNDRGSRDSINSIHSRTLPRNNRRSYFENQQYRSMTPDINNRGGSGVNRIYHNNGFHNRNSENSGNYANHNNQQQQRQQTRNFGRSNHYHQQQQNYPNRYSSHGSLTSDSGAYERRGRANNNARRNHHNSRGKSQDWEEPKHENNTLTQENNWPPDQQPASPTQPPPPSNVHDSEAVKETTRTTTNYMQYLSQT